MAAPKKNPATDKGQDKKQDKGNGSKNPSHLEFTREQELQALRDMLLIRRFEEKAGQLYGMGAIGGFRSQGQWLKKPVTSRIHQRAGIAGPARHAADPAF